MKRSLVSLALVLTACSSSNDAPAPAPQPTPDDSTPATPAAPAPVDPPPPPAPPFTPAFPKVESRGGPVIKNPKIQPIIFSSDTAQMKTDIASFAKKLAASTFWGQTTGEYGVGAATAADPIVITEAPGASLTSAQIETWLAGKLTGASPELGAPDADTLYAIFYPSGVSITMDGAGEMGQSCQGYGGYHYEIQAGAKTVGYAVLPRCAGLEDLTVAAAHEAFEWATDPFPTSNPAFAKLDDDHWAWQAAMIGELGDLCTFLDFDHPVPSDIGYSVQRLWSNKLSLAGHFPCGPNKPGAYIQAVAEAADDAYVPDYSTPGGNTYIKTKAIRVKPGTSRKVDVHIYSDDPNAKPVAIYAMNMEELYQKPSTTGFKYALSKSTASPGDLVELTIDSPSQQSMDVVMMSSVTSAREATYWPVTITNDDAANAVAGVPSVTPDMMPRIAPGSRIGRGPRITRLGLVRHM